MTDRLSRLWPLTSRAALLAGLVLVHGPAFAERREAHHPMRRIVRVRPLPAVPPPVLVRDYLPRNLNVPMYNEPPRRAPAW
ncbi:hypothetical protein [Methylobacterium radiotolerans]|uniref:Uncharacterized protein n=1 Tax=Methylobacterium radiotolerans (strain ATCC 27329 / DSM 1819 / JCM 2831 / NBRC 15690 / NCIMB 10815 / 0-1) TaxID=426355 RepID=B1M3G7_METRJ|nr:MULTISPECIES: hypothetical protein [Methylobacterium]ACB26307.1 hypothetical protein Mrad2831_4341 [Methylobacterium radiotolerans JCM 2831]KZB99644.1 hypothetical protein AU375_04126 [Methylobacterium radiotolerans]MBY0255095.1 hypothetical protein [Methylobacterium organophilum]MDE3744728.1 hypothetical protein [Methylobacterium radiotolerans]ONF48085.1 hypothetical protein RSM1_16140 [Methylobacterium radiotolerans]